MWYDQGTTELTTDGWIVISWLVTWGCLDFSSLAHLLGTCHLCLIFPSSTPLIGIAFYRTSGRLVQSKAISDEDTLVCISLLSCFTLVDQVDNTFAVESQKCPTFCHWLQIPGLSFSQIPCRDNTGFVQEVNTQITCHLPQVCGLPVSWLPYRKHNVCRRISKMSNILPLTSDSRTFSQSNTIPVPQRFRRISRLSSNLPLGADSVLYSLLDNWRATFFSPPFLFVESAWHWLLVSDSKTPWLHVSHTDLLLRQAVHFLT